MTSANRWTYAAELWPSAFRSTSFSSDSICSSTGPWHQGPQLNTSSALEREAQRLLDLGTVSGEIRRRHQPTVLAVILRDRPGDVAAIEGVARCRKTGVATVDRRRLLLVGHELDRAAEIGLHQPVAFTQRLAVAMVDRGVLRPAAIVLDLVRRKVAMTVWTAKPSRA